MATTFLRERFPGLIWPPIPSSRSQRLLAMLFQLEQTQWYSREELSTHQWEQLSQVVKFAAAKVAFYGDDGRWGARLSSLGGWDDFRSLPILERSDVQAAGVALHAERCPPQHGSIGKILTSGSTGQPVMALTTEVTRELWRLLTLREHFWHRRDFGGSLAAIRDTENPAARPPNGKILSNWGSATLGVVKTGPAHLLSIQSSLDDQAAWLRHTNPDYLLAYPTTVAALVEIAGLTKESLPGLREVRTFGEILEPHARTAIRQALGVPVVDVYSSHEVGYIALQCPVSGDYHIQAESLVVELLREDGSACEPGDTGRVVVTTLHNFAMPLIRYAIGDYAELGSPCPCGRGLPTLKRIWGRQRNMLRLPNGEQRWPTLVRGERPEELPPLQQFQLVQTSFDNLELRVVRNSPFSTEEEERLRTYVRQTLEHPFDVSITRVDSIPRSPSGKYEEFRCEL